MLPKRVKWAVSDFASFTSPGIDGIYPVVLQKGIDIIIERLVRLLQASIALGYIPTQWRTARVVFVPKPGHNDYTQPKSFRPISLMSFLLKTTERLIHRHIRDGPLVRYHLHANQHACGHLLRRFAIQQQSTAPQSGHALLTQVGSMCS